MRKRIVIDTDKRPKAKIISLAGRKPRKPSPDAGATADRKPKSPAPTTPEAA